MAPSSWVSALSFNSHVAAIVQGMEATISPGWLRVLAVRFIACP